MSILQGILGNASEQDVEEVQEELKEVLITAEKVEHAYKIVRDLFIFTNKRLILVDKQGLTGRKKEFLSVPYSSISFFSFESAGTFDLDADMKIGIRSAGTIIKKFKRDSNIEKVQRTLAEYVL